MLLIDIIRAAERGEFPPVDMGFTHVPQPSARDAAVLGFTGHNVIAADIDPTWVAALLPPDDPAAPFVPPVLDALAGKLGRRVNSIDMLLMAPRLPGPAPLRLTELADRDHPRVRRALRYRDDVRVWSVEGGLLVLGRGLAGRWEMAIEVDPLHRGAGLGRALAVAARHLVPEDRPVWAQVAVGNAASVRAILRAGYVPVGEEALLPVRRDG